MDTIRAWLERYLEALERDNASPYTVKNYRTDIGQFLDYCAEYGVNTLAGLQRDLVRDYLEELAEAEYARSSIARRVFELRAFGDRRALAIGDDDGDPILVAFIEVRDAAGAAAVTAADAVVAGLGRAARPGDIRQVARLPHLPNGKVDRQLLSEWARTGEGT